MEYSLSTAITSEKWEIWINNGLIPSKTDSCRNF